MDLVESYPRPHTEQSLFHTRFEMAKFTYYAAVLVTAIMFAGSAEAGNYRRIFLVSGEVTGYAVDDYLGLKNSTCFDIPLYDFATNRLVGTAQDCTSEFMMDDNCTMGLTLTAATNFSIGTDGYFVNRA